MWPTIPTNKRALSRTVPASVCHSSSQIEIPKIVAALPLVAIGVWLTLNIVGAPPAQVAVDPVILLRNINDRWEMYLVGLFAMGLSVTAFNIAACLCNRSFTRRGFWLGLGVGYPLGFAVLIATFVTATWFIPQPVCGSPDGACISAPGQQAPDPRSAELQVSKSWGAAPR